jgi:hypothetical protein
MKQTKRKPPGYYKKLAAKRETHIRTLHFKFYDFMHTLVGMLATQPDHFVDQALAILPRNRKLQDAIIQAIADKKRDLKEQADFEARFRSGKFTGTVEHYHTPIVIGSTVVVHDRHQQFIASDGTEFRPHKFTAPTRRSITLQDQADVDRFNAMLEKQNAKP